MPESRANERRARAEREQRMSEREREDRESSRSLMSESLPPYEPLCQRTATLIRSGDRSPLFHALISALAYRSPIRRRMTSQADQWSGKARSRSADRLSLASLATIVHNAPPIDSPVFRWTIGALARDAIERETLRPWREALRSARRWIFSARCCLVRDARKPVRNANAKD
jgi:hypothetical protein